MLAVRSPSSASLAEPAKLTLSPRLKPAPSAGAEMLTLGAALTVMVMASESWSPPASVTLAVMTWVPADSAAVATDPPVPMAPSRLDVHAMLAVRSPSSASFAEPTKVTLSPLLNPAPSVGAVMLTLGAALTVMVMASESCKPPASVTLAVMTWVPADSAAVAKDPPLPMAPSRSDVHAMFAVRSPSSASLAEPAKLTLSPRLKPAPSVGAVMLTLGAALTVMVMASESCKPPASVTEAVMTWVPAESAAVLKDPPEPMAPSRSEVHAMLAVRSPSSASLAEPVNVTLSPVLNPAPSTGAVIVTLGAALTVMVMASLSWSPPASVTLAVMTWVPADSAAVEKEPPLPMAPSRSDVHAMLAVRSPSSASLAEPVKVTLSPVLKPAPSAGAVMLTLGAALTVMVMASESCKPPASMTLAVMTWVPADSAALLKDPPEPMAPSRSEVHAMLAVKSPSSASLAEPVKLTLSPTL